MKIANPIAYRPKDMSVPFRFSNLCKMSDAWCVSTNAPRELAINENKRPECKFPGTFPTEGSAAREIQQSGRACVPIAGRQEQPVLRHIPRPHRQSIERSPPHIRGGRYPSK